MIQPNEFVSLRTLRLIEASRVILAVALSFSLAISQSTFVNPPRIAMLLAAYLGISLVSLVGLYNKRLAYWLLNNSLVLQIIDTMTLGALVHMSGGADSPFFPALSLLTATATIQWGAHGAIIMGFTIMLIYLPTGISATMEDTVQNQELPHFVSRFITVGLNTLILTVLGKHFERIIRHMVSLSRSFPDYTSPDTPPLESCLQHACSLMGVGQGILLWQEQEEPHAYLHIWANGASRQIRIALTEPVMGPEWLDDVFLYSPDGVAFVQREKRIISMEAGLLPQALRRYVAYPHALVMHAATRIGNCWIFVPENGDQATEELTIGRFIVAQTSLALNKWQSERERLELRTREERLRLGRGLHDGVLQFLAGTSLQLGALSRSLQNSPEAQSRIADLQNALREEQRELRAFVHEAGHRHPEQRTPAQDMDRLVKRLAKHWNISATTHCTLKLEALPDFLWAELTHMTREAVANSVRHGKATELTITLAGDDTHIQLRIEDNGSGFGIIGQREVDAANLTAQIPLSIFTRTRALGGTLLLWDTDTGATIQATIPLDPSKVEAMA